MLRDLNSGGKRSENRTASRYEKVTGEKWARAYAEKCSKIIEQGEVFREWKQSLRGQLLREVTQENIYAVKLSVQEHAGETNKQMLQDFKTCTSPGNAQARRLPENHRIDVPRVREFTKIYTPPLMRPKSLIRAMTTK